MNILKEVLTMSNAWEDFLFDTYNAKAIDAYDLANMDIEDEDED